MSIDSEILYKPIKVNQLLQCLSVNGCPTMSQIYAHKLLKFMNLLAEHYNVNG